MEYKTNNRGNLELSFNSHIAIERSASPTLEPVGQMDSTMELFVDDKGVPNLIEWIVGEGEDFVEHIGLWFDGKSLSDYDGVFSLPIQAVKLIRKSGYTVPRDFED